MAKRKLTDAVLFAFLKRSRESDKPNTQIVEEIAVEFNADASLVKKIVVRFQVLKARNPGKKYALDENCFILLDGRQINSCRELTGSGRHNQPWKQIERACLLCSFSNHKNGDSVQEVAEDLAPYFDREPSALIQEFYRINKSNK